MNPTILIVDDRPDELRFQVIDRLKKSAVPIVVHPDEVDLTDLKTADLVLVDYRLDAWPERDKQSVSLRPSNGMALAVVLREQADSQKDGETAFALHTGHLEDLKRRLPSGTVQNVLARLNNLEWLFSKEDSGNYEQMLLLANAIRELPKKWPSDPGKSCQEVRKLLGMVDGSESFDRCWSDVRECRVPVQDLIEGGYGILFVRWLLHEVLPYPSFLWEEHWVAARFAIPVDDLRKVIEGDSRLARDLKCMRYTGILAGFLGDRWWRGALEDYVWELSGQYRERGKSLREALNERAELELGSIEVNPAVVCLNADLEPTGQFLTPATAVTVHPDHWPAFADSAWMDLNTVQDDPRLLPIVDPLDRHRVNNGNE